MRGFVPTPDPIVDLMVDRLFAERRPTIDSTILDPGCGPGAFIAGIIRWCERHSAALPKIVGIESEPGRCGEARDRFAAYPSVQIIEADFLSAAPQVFDYVIGNPPYVPITALSGPEKASFRARFSTAAGRFDLYLLFFEQGLRMLKPGGRLVFITPEKFLYVMTARPLRKLMSQLAVHSVHLLAEETFGSLVTYPTITMIDNRPPEGPTAVVLRDGSAREVSFPADGASLLPLLAGDPPSAEGRYTLEDICLRVSCGVATGADEIFVLPANEVGPELAALAHPTIAGKQLLPDQPLPRSSDVMLIPYDHEGRLLPFAQLGALGQYLAAPERRPRLEQRTCARRKPWYSFHETPPLSELLRPKLLCKDIAAEPRFWIDRDGLLVPRHSVYYLVPRDPSRLDDLARYLGSREALAWMRTHCQRAANGFIRLQSTVLKRLPVPSELVDPLAKDPHRREPLAQMEMALSS